ITESNYHQDEVTAAERGALGLTVGERYDVGNFEFIEFQNISGQTIQLAGGSFVAGIAFDFNRGSGSVTTLDSGQFVLVVKNQAAFEARYGSGLNIAGEFADGSLDNNGETITLHDAVGGTIHEFTYNDGGEWPGRADGTGSTLLVIDLAGDYDDAENWRASVELGGSPGEQGLGAFHDVVINEILTHTDPPQLDAIELFNTTTGDVDVSGWYLSDTKNNLKKFRIPGTPGGPDATIIAAGGYLVFDENDFNPSGGLDPLNNPNDFAFSSAAGDDAWLLAADAAGRLVRFADHAEFGAAANGVSFGLVIDSTGRGSYAAMQQLTIGGPNSPPRVGPVVIHEIMYNPGPEGGGSEFVELLNISDEAVSLAGWNFDGIDFTFGDEALIEPGGLVVVVPDPIAFLIVHDELSEDDVFGPYDGALNNAGESLRLNRPDEPQIDGFIPSITVDQVRYNDKAPWPVEADGTGVALQRITPEEYGNDPINWGVTLPGGTPGNFFILPTVLEVRVSGSRWSPAMLDRISAAGLGPDGFSIPAGEDQLRTIAWTGVDRISLRFSEHVEVTSDDLQVAGVNVSDYLIIGFEYDRPSRTASWTLQRPVEADNLLIAVSANVRDGSGFPLDGNWTDAASTFPSGNGAIDSGDAFQFRLNVLPGDVTSAGGVSRGDLLAVIGALGTSADRPRYDARLDIDGDGRIGVDDLRQLLLRQGSRLPSAEPQAGGPLPRIAVDAVFERMGQAGAAQAATTPSVPTRRIRRVTSSSSTAIELDRPLHRYQGAATGRTIANDATDTTADRNAIFIRRSRRSPAS
ncbi:MAG: lamin tail domain-containing protein, partial [Planctomycetes bacterium]|nr:lamin tail domain-containing protein [Planctomycetota bacterium]